MWLCNVLLLEPARISRRLIRIYEARYESETGALTFCVALCGHPSPSPPGPEPCSHAPVIRMIALPNSAFIIAGQRHRHFIVSKKRERERERERTNTHAEVKLVWIPILSSQAFSYCVLTYGLLSQSGRIYK